MRVGIEEWWIKEMEKIKIKEVKKRNKMKLKVEEMKEIKGLM